MSIGTNSSNSIKHIETKVKPTFKVRINRNHTPVTLKDISDQINALQRSVAYVTSRPSKLDYLASRQRESHKRTSQICVCAQLILFQKIQRPRKNLSCGLFT
jgi:hypothetical protein